MTMKTVVTLTCDGCPVEQEEMQTGIYPEGWHEFSVQETITRNNPDTMSAPRQAVMHIGPKCWVGNETPFKVLNTEYQLALITADEVSAQE